MKWAVLVSGSGTILESMLAEGLTPDLVVADRPGIRALDVVAKNSGVPAVVINRREFGYNGTKVWDRPGFSVKMASLLIRSGIGLTAMAGFDTILDPEFFENYSGTILNTHPALLPAFKGLYGANVIRAVLDTGVAETGCTIHVATAEVDDSRVIVAQKIVPVLRADDVEALWERIKIEERKLYPQVVAKILNGQMALPQITKSKISTPQNL